MILSYTLRSVLVVTVTALVKSAPAPSCRASSFLAMSFQISSAW